MARPVKKRRVCSLPDVMKFGPSYECFKALEEDEVIRLSIDEYEVIRLIDYEGLTQLEAASQIDVARTTVQAIYSEGRKKLSKALVEGKRLEIEGGNYKLCKGNKNCLHKRCRRKACREGLDENNSSSEG